MSKSRKFGIAIGVIAFSSILLLVMAWVVLPIFSSKSTEVGKNDVQDTSINNRSNVVDSNFIKSLIPEADSSIRIVKVSSPDELESGIDEEAGKRRKVFDGRRINIALIGVDSRMGSSFKHADANHVLSILVDQGKMEIFSIPRDTPAYAGFADSTGQNKITVLYAVKSKTTYLDTLAKIAGLNKIHYYVEVGFSQVIGILEFLGYKDAGSTLQVLRSRTAIGGNDYQRVYNQAQFVRQMIIRHFDKFTAFYNEILIRALLAMVNTNLSTETAKNIFSQMEKSGFPNGDNAVTIKIRPPIPIKYKVYDFTNQEVVNSLKDIIQNYNTKRDTDSTHSVGRPNVANRLEKALHLAILDTAKRPNQVIQKLKTYYDQRAWLQVTDRNRRDIIREEFGELLSKAYFKKNNPSKAQEIINTINLEKELFRKKNIDSFNNERVE